VVDVLNYSTLTILDLLDLSVLTFLLKSFANALVFLMDMESRLPKLDYFASSDQIPLLYVLRYFYRRLSIYQL